MQKSRAEADFLGKRWAVVRNLFGFFSLTLASRFRVIALSHCTVGFPAFETCKKFQRCLKVSNEVKHQIIYTHILSWKKKSCKIGEFYILFQCLQITWAIISSVVWMVGFYHLLTKQLHEKLTEFTPLLLMPLNKNYWIILGGSFLLCTWLGWRSFVFMLVWESLLL